MNENERKVVVRRMLLLIAVACIIMGLYTFRLIFLQLVNGDSFKAKATNTTDYKFTVTAARGNIVDSTGKRIATTSTGYNVVLNKLQMGDQDLDTMLQQIVELLRKNDEKWLDTLLISEPDAAGNYTFTDSADSTSDQKTLADMKETLQKMKRVLRRLGYIDDADVVQEKGRVACEINSADELLITELIYDGVFIDLDPKQCVALLAAITFQEKVRMGWRSDAKDDETMKVRAEMKGAYDKLKETARRVATVCNECKLPVDVEEYVGKLKPTMMEILYEWASGSKFSDICKMTNVFEGTIIRYIRLLGR